MKKDLKKVKDAKDREEDEKLIEKEKRKVEERQAEEEDE